MTYVGSAEVKDLKFSVEMVQLQVHVADGSQGPVTDYWSTDSTAALA